MKKFCLCLIISFISFQPFSQNISAIDEKRWSIAASSGFVFAHSKDVQNTKGAHPRGVQGDYAWRNIDSVTYKKFYGFPVQGLSISYFNFDNTALGHGIAAAYFIEPDIRIHKKAGCHIRAAVGAICLTNPYDPRHNPANNSYSSSLSGYLSVSVYPYFLVLPKWQVMVGGSYRHTSNGGLKLPNKGINWITGEIILCYFPVQKTDIGAILKPYMQEPYEKYLRWDASVFLAGRGIDDTSNVRYGVSGVDVQVVKQTGKTHAFSVGAEIYYDIGDRQQMKAEAVSNTALKSSAMLGHEFLWGNYIFSQQIGVYLFDFTPYYPSWFHRWGLYRTINDKWAAGINLKAHKQVANFVDLRLVYTFSKKNI